MKLKRASATALGLSIAFVAGCSSGGKSKSAGASIAGATSSTTATPSPLGSGSVTGVTSGSTAGVGSAAAVNATVTLDHFIAVREKSAIADMVAPRDLVNQDKLFILEDAGSVRVLDLAGPKPVLDRMIPLDPALPQGCLLGSLWISDDGSMACATASGGGKELLYLFDPSLAKSSADVAKFDFSAVKLDFPVSFQNSAGVTVGQTLQPTFLSGAVVAGNKLYVASSNIDKSFDYNPGTVLAFDWDPVTKSLTKGQVIATTGWNPSRLTVWHGPMGEEAVLVTVGGEMNKGLGMIDVIDAASAKLQASIPLGAANVAGPIAISLDGKRGYVGSTSDAAVQVLDLDGLELELLSPVPMSLPARALPKIDLPRAAGSLNYVSGLALSESGDYLYASNFNDSSVSIVDLTGAQPALAGQASGFVRSGDAAKFEGNASLLAVRPGRPGVDFQGPALFVATINIAKADRKVTDVNAAIDAVELDKN